MNDDILKSISQGSNNTETAENKRIHEIADELRRGCELYEAQFRNSQSSVRRFDTEQRVAEKYAKENGIWLPSVYTKWLTRDISSIQYMKCGIYYQEMF